MFSRLTVLAALLIPAVVATGQDHIVFLRDLRVEAGQSRTPAGEDVRAPQPIMPFPGYPRDLLAAGVTGEAEVRYFVRADGSVSNLGVIEASHPGFGDSARNAVARWKFPSEQRAFGGIVYQFTELWMRARFEFMLGEDDGVPSYYPDYAHARLSGRDVLDLAYAAGNGRGTNLRSYPINRIQGHVYYTGKQLIWYLTFRRETDSAGGNIEVFIDDATRDAQVAPAGGSRPHTRENELPFVMVSDPRPEGSSAVFKASATLMLPDYGQMFRQGVAGSSTARFRVDAQGSVAESRVVQASGEFFESSIKSTVSQWKFQPPAASSGPNPSETWLRTRITFHFYDPWDSFNGGLQSGASNITMSAHDVLLAAIGRARAEDVDLAGRFDGVPAIGMTQSGMRLTWSVTWTAWVWDNQKPRTEFARVLVDDQSRRTTFEKGFRSD